MVALKLLSGSLQQLNWRAAAERLQPLAARWNDVSTRFCPGNWAGWIGEDDNRKFKTLRLVYGHHPHAFAALFDNRRLASIAAFGTASMRSTNARNELASGSKRRAKPTPRAICERLLASQPQRDASMSAYRLQQRRNGLRNGAVIAPGMKLCQQD